MSELKITKDDIGKRFRRRDGKVVTVTQWDDDDSEYPVEIDSVTCYTEGGFFYSSRVKSSLDLVERLDDATDTTPEPQPFDAEFRNGVAVQTLQTLIKARPNQSVEYYAETAYQIADAMLAERAKGAK